ncbi:hypothetical protein PHLGIDRAFT_107713 [Phlebiopsis gigantea 11061_1 CR5-6]|uniref:Uncharacterized protein n=1 Tax=Phlebiopsis gigantea (strain 11061_1 CR5-6) TaxID=745531 RepID=A0A0C3NLH4_PHLG1|nr:hypothetical protein PHLGIDRAFT_107713 [Phlebiopsis gigantea 11061_1 CR5-6]
MLGYESPPPRRLKPAEMCKQLERSLREVQELLKARDREVEMLKRERDRALLERDREKEKRMDAERRRERDRERERERDREREREKEREKQRERERERRERNTLRRSRSQAPTSFYSSLTAETETLVHAQSLDVFLTKTDSWSGAQVIQAVEDLNAEITHFAASATESCVFVARSASGPRRRSRSGQPPPGPQATMVLEDAVAAAPWLSSSLVRILTTHEHSTDPLLVQLALQASVATCCARSLSLFCVGFPAKLDGLLGRIYGQMATAEPQPTSSRWRALTHRSIRSLYPGLEEYAVSELVTTMLRWSAAVFDVSGCSPKDKSDASSSTLRSQLRRIAEAVYKLALVTREDILSTNFEVVLVESGGAFDGVSMCNAFAEGHDGAHGRAGDKILCTTELGLKCTTRRGKGQTERESVDEMFERRTLLQPKVVLEEAVDAILA